MCIRDRFDENIFSVVQELPYKFNFQGSQIFSFRPDIVTFVNGIYLGYSELKSNYTCLLYTSTASTRSSSASPKPTAKTGTMRSMR